MTEKLALDELDNVVGGVRTYTIERGISKGVEVFNITCKTEDSSSGSYYSSVSHMTIPATKYDEWRKRVMARDGVDLPTQDKIK